MPDNHAVPDRAVDTIHQPRGLKLTARFEPTPPNGWSWRDWLAVLLIGIAIPNGLSAAVPFGGPETMISITAPTHVESADVNRDGAPDLIAVSESAGTLHWAEWTGASFTVHEISNTLSAPVDTATADFNCDGRPDIAVADAGAGNVELFLQTGLNAWTQTTPPSTIASGVARVIAADIDRDGSPDIALARPGVDKVTVLRNLDCDAAGWPQSTVTSAADGVADLDSFDLDGDGFLDFALAGEEADEVLLSLGDSAGSYTTTTLGFMSGVRRVTSGDFDQDGDIDVISSSATSTYWWWNENGSWTLDNPSALGAASLSTGDLDGDSDLDVLVSGASTVRGGEGALGWWENGDTWSFHELDIPSAASSATLLDLGRDGDLDAAVALGSGDQIVILENIAIHRAARFPDELFLPPPHGFIDLVDMDVGDVDGDGDADFVITERDLGSATANVFWFENVHDGASDYLQFVGPLSLASTAFATFEGTTLGDFDGDGALDVFVGSDFDFAITARFCPQPASLSTEWTCHSISSGTYETIDPQTAADLDGDGDLDVLGEAIEAGTGAIHVMWWENDGDPTQSAGWIERVIDTPAHRRSLNVGDLDRDGDLDILTSNETWWRNNGTSPVTWTEETIPDFFGLPAVGDIDQDGDLDVVGIHIDLINGPTIAWFENRLPRTRWVNHTIWEASDASGPSAGRVLVDIDGDGDLDVVSGSSGEQDQLAWYENEGGQASTPWHAHSLPFADFSPDHIAVHDFDLDADADVVAEPAGLGAFYYWSNGAGQFGLETVVQLQTPVPGTELSVFRTNGHHAGRAGDLDMEVSALELRFESAPGAPLSQGEFDELVTDIGFWFDGGSSVFDGEDSLVTSWSGITLDGTGKVTLNLPPGSDGALLEAGEFRTYFVTLSLATGAGDATLAEFLVVFDPRSSAAVDAAQRLPLQAQWYPDATASLSPGAAIFIDGFESGNTNAWQ